MQFPTAICNRLHDDHMATVQLLEWLEASLKKLGRKQTPDTANPDLARLLAEIARVMRREVTDHFGFEEAHLFPRVAMFGDSPMLSILQVEHDTIRPLASRAAALAETALADGFTAETWAEFFDLGMELVERETFHIQKEEMGFLPLLAQVLTDHDDDELSELFEMSKKDA